MTILPLSAAPSGPAPAQGVDGLRAEVVDLLQRARVAARLLQTATTAQKNAFLARTADRLRQQAELIEQKNAVDLDASRSQGRNAAFLDRLRLDRRAAMAVADSVDQVRSLPDPIGQITSGSRQPNGLRIRKERIALGVIGMIYESRPNVTVDAAVLCVKAGNSVVLRGGSEARHTNLALCDLLRAALTDVGLPADAVLYPLHTDHAVIAALVGQVGGLDLAIPRGGTALIDAVNAHARVPVIQHYQGVCHIYVHHAADLDQALPILINAKAQRPGVCNAAEAILVDAAIAAQAVPRIVEQMQAAGVQVRGCPRVMALVGPPTIPAQSQDDGCEFLDLIVLLRVVDDLDAAVSHIAQYGSRHTEAILTTDLRAANAFTQRVDASCVMINASTRFNDGGCLGLGAEIGISTTKLHAYGPMGLQHLTAERWVVVGDGHIRT